MFEAIKSFLMTRGAQLAARYIGVGLTVAAVKTGVTLDPVQLESISSGLTMLILGGVFTLADHYIHSQITTPATAVK